MTGFCSQIILFSRNCAILIGLGIEHIRPEREVWIQRISGQRTGRMPQFEQNLAGEIELCITISNSEFSDIILVAQWTMSTYTSTLAKATTFCFFLPEDSIVQHFQHTTSKQKINSLVQIFFKSVFLSQQNQQSLELVRREMIGVLSKLIKLETPGMGLRNLLANHLSQEKLNLLCAKMS